MSVSVTENLWIPLADGTRLAARLWLPADADTVPVPTVLEYIPYRKRDGTRDRDEPMHSWFAANGYAAIRVDMRGSGESDGLLADEYLKQEQDDAVEAIAWIAAQPWCTGVVGMMGKSWGGFNSLQVAARRPPALKAIVTVCSTDDRYADDIHYMGGCLLNDNHWWGAIMLAYQARPLDPEIVGDAWRADWLKRLDAMPLWPGLWMEHPLRDDYWRHGSVCEGFSAIECPVLAIGGWADSYTNAVPRLLEGLSVPRQAIVGPWAHIYPQDATPAPAIGFLQEAKQWWDRWLKGEANGAEAKPMLRAYVEDWMKPETSRPAADGRWVAEPVWPSPSIAPQVLHLADQGLAATGALTAARPIRSPLWTGIAAGEWMGTGVEGEMPADQRLDDGGSLVFDGAPLSEPLEILGFPVIELDLTADKPTGQIAVRLEEVAPDGASLRVAYGVLNLTHRNGHERAEPLQPGERFSIRLPLKVAGHRFAAGHRLRIAISTAYWPLLWPAADATTLTVHAGRLALPVRTPRAEDATVAFEPPVRGPRAPSTRIAEGSMVRSASIDLIANRATYVTDGRGGLFGEGVVRFDEIGTSNAHDLRRELTISGDDPLSARYRIDQAYEIGRDGWRIRIETVSELTADATAFRLTAHLRAFENGTLVRERSWDERYARDGV